MSSNQIQPVNNNATSGGNSNRPNGIIQNANQQDPNAAWILAENNVLTLNGQVQINNPIFNTSEIISSDQSSKIKCLDGGQIQVTGEIDMQNNNINNIPNPSQQQQPVTLNYLENNYDDTQQTQNYIGQAISNLSSVYMPINETLDAINQPIQALDLNFQRISNLADPQQQDDGIPLNYLQANYTDTTLSQQYVDQQISALSTVYYPQSYKLNQIAQPTASMNFNGQRLTNIGINSASTDAVRQDFITDNYSTTAISQNFVNTQISGLSSVYMPIDQTLDEISNTNLCADSVNLNNQKIINVQDGVDLQDCVTVNQIQNLLPTTTNINGLQAQTANYDSSGFQMTVSSVPDQNNSLTNKQYVDGQITSIQNNYVSNTSLASQLLAFVQLAYLQANYYTTTQVDNLISGLSSIYLSIASFNSQIANYYTSAQVDSLISGLSSIYLSISSFNSQISNYVLTSFLTANYYTQTYINSTFATIASLGSYVSLTYLTDNFYTQTQSNNLFQLITNMNNYPTFGALTSELSYYLTIYNAGQIYQPIANMVNYITSAQLTTALSSYVTSAYLTTQNYLRVADIANYTQQIQSTSTLKSKVSCSSASEILFNVNDIQKMKIYTGVGQSTDPTVLEFPDKIQFTTAENAFSITGTKAIQTSQQNGTGLYLKTPYNASEALFCQFSTQPNSSNCQNLTMSSGQVNVPGLGMTQYSAICNGSGGVQQNLQISAALPNLGDQTLNFYSNSYAAALGQNLKAQFTDKVGYSSAISITESHQFTSKSYIDGLISALSSVYLTISSFNTTIALYYTKIQSDARFYLNSVTLNNITPPTGSLSMNSQKITNILDPTLAQDAATKKYVDTQAASGITLATAKANFIALDGSQTNLITAPIPMNSQKITGMANGSDPQDAITYSQAQTAIQAVSQVIVGSITIWPSTTIPSGYFECNGNTFNQANHPQLYAVLGNSNVLPDLRSVFVRGLDQGRGIDTGRTLGSLQQDAYENHLHSIPSQSYSTQVDGSHAHTSSISNVEGTLSRPNTGGNSTGTFSVASTGSAHSHSIITPVFDTSFSTTGQTETRPINVALVYIIKH